MLGKSISYSALTCPSDTVIWANSLTYAYHLPGEPWFGRTKDGRYIAAGRASDQATRNRR